MNQICPQLLIHDTISMRLYQQANNQYLSPPGNMSIFNNIGIKHQHNFFRFKSLINQAFPTLENVTILLAYFHSELPKQVLPTPMLLFPFILFQFKLPLFFCFPLFPAHNLAFGF